MMGERLYGLDALRGIAAVSVAIHHFTRIYSLPVFSPSISVDLFFILSGFVMTRTYEERLRRGDLTTLRFIWLRYRRLFLPLAAGSTIGLAWIAATYGLSIQLVAAYAVILCFLPLAGGSAFPLNGPVWSVFVEIVCNVLHGMVFARLSNWALATLTAASATVFTVCFAYGLSVWAPPITSIVWLIPRELTCYLVGLWTFRRYGDTPFGSNPLLAIGAFIATLGLASINTSLEMLALIACPFIVRASLGLPRAGWAIWGGAISYPLYATHVPVLQAWRAMGLPGEIGLLVAGAVALFVTVAFETRRGTIRPSIEPHHTSA